jgi:hypothetical protein
MSNRINDMRASQMHTASYSVIQHMSPTSRYTKVQRSNDVQWPDNTGLEVCNLTTPHLTLIGDETILCMAVR